VFRNSQQLAKYGLRNFRVHWLPRWLPEMKSLDFAITGEATSQPVSSGKTETRG